MKDLVKKQSEFVSFPIKLCCMDEMGTEEMDMDEGRIHGEVKRGPTFICYFKRIFRK